METALILLIATVVALAAAWSRERLLRKSDAEKNQRDVAEQRLRREVELKEQSLWEKLIMNGLPSKKLKKNLKPISDIFES